MDHIVFLDSGSSELDNLLEGKKSMILKGGNLINPSYGNVMQGDTLYLADSNKEGKIRAKGIVAYVYKSGKLSVEESYEIVIRNQDKLQLPDNQFYTVAGKQYLVLITIERIEAIEPFQIEKIDLDQSDDWFSVGNIDLIMADPSRQI
jgi:hypothetical protein